MPTAWTDFEQCVNDRIAYYRQSYGRATRIYQKILGQNNTSEEELTNLLEFQQAMADEICRCRRLLIKYSLKKPPPLSQQLAEVEPLRLN